MHTFRPGMKCFSGSLSSVSDVQKSARSEFFRRTAPQFCCGISPGAGDREPRFLCLARCAPCTVRRLASLGGFFVARCDVEGKRLGGSGVGRTSAFNACRGNPQSRALRFPWHSRLVRTSSYLRWPPRLSRSPSHRLRMYIRSGRLRPVRRLAFRRPQNILGKPATSK